MSYIEKAINDLLFILATKNGDYRIDGEFSNFEFAAKVADLGERDVFMTQIGIKIGRLKGQAQGVYNHETYRDTVKDLAGYAILYYAYELSLQEQENNYGPE